MLLSFCLSASFRYCETISSRFSKYLLCYGLNGWPSWTLVKIISVCSLFVGLFLISSLFEYLMIFIKWIHVYCLEAEMKVKILLKTE